MNWFDASKQEQKWMAIMIWKQGRCDKCFTQEINNDHTHWGNAYRAGQCSLVQRTGQWFCLHPWGADAYQVQLNVPQSFPTFISYVFRLHSSLVAPLQLEFLVLSRPKDRLDVYFGVKAKNKGYLLWSSCRGFQLDGCRCHGVQVNGHGQEESAEKCLQHRRAFLFL